MSKALLVIACVALVSGCEYLPHRTEVCVAWNRWVDPDTFAVDHIDAITGDMWFRGRIIHPQYVTSRIIRLSDGKMLWAADYEDNGSRAEARRIMQVGR